MFSMVQSRYDAIFDATLGKLWITRLWDKIDREMPASRTMLTRHDLWLALALGVFGVLVSLWAFMQTNRVPEIHTTFNLWLDADIARVAENLVTTSGDHGRTAVHPIFSIVLYPIGGLLAALGIDPMTAAKIVTAMVSGASVALFSLTIRLLGLPRMVVALFTLLFMVSASFMFWSAVVESHPFSGFTAIAALFLMLRVKTAHWAWWVVVSALTLGFLLTNWVFALVAMAVRLKLKPLIGISITSVLVVMVLAVLQNAAFERAALFFNPETLLRETHHTQPYMVDEGVMDQGWNPADNVRSFYVTTMVAMPVEVGHGYRRLMTTNQTSALPAGEVSPIIAIIAWVIVLGMGFWGASKLRNIRPALIGAAILLAMQTVLFTLYGPVTFLFNPNFMPLLILFASLAWYAPLRIGAVALTGLVIVFAGINNERRFQQTIELADCLSDIESVMRLNTYALIRDNETPILTDASVLYTDDVLSCQPEAN